MPGDPQDVKANSLNSTSIHVNWKPPLEKDRNGIIRGYHIHVQEVRDEVSRKSPRLIFQILSYSLVFFQLFIFTRVKVI